MAKTVTKPAPAPGPAPEDANAQTRPAEPILATHLRPQGMRVLIDMDDEADVSAGGIFIPAKKQNDPMAGPSVSLRTATVLAVGPGQRCTVDRLHPNEPGMGYHPIPFEPGQRVLVNAHDCVALPAVVGDGKYHLIIADHVLAAVDRPEEA